MREKFYNKYRNAIKESGFVLGRCKEDFDAQNYPNLTFKIKSIPNWIFRIVDCGGESEFIGEWAPALKYFGRRFDMCEATLASRDLEDFLDNLKELEKDADLGMICSWNGWVFGACKKNKKDAEYIRRKCDKWAWQEHLEEKRILGLLRDMKSNHSDIEAIGYNVYPIKILDEILYVEYYASFITKNGLASNVNIDWWRRKGEARRLRHSWFVGLESIEEWTGTKEFFYQRMKYFI